MIDNGNRSAPGDSRGVELIGISDPAESWGVVDVVEEVEVEVARNAKDGLNAKLTNAPPEEQTQRYFRTHIE